MSSNIAVKVTADIVDLRAKMALAQAEVRSTASELNKAASAARSSGLGDKLTPDLLKAAEASAGATGKLKGLRQEVEQLGGGGGHGSVNSATREFRALFDELTSGRTQNTPGTLAIIGQRVFGLGPAALGALAGVGLLTAGLGYLAIEGIKAAQAIDKINLSMLGTQGFAATQEQIRGTVDQVRSLGAVSREEAEKVVGAFATMQNRSQGTFQGLSLATVAWAQLTGQETDKAAESLSKVFGAPFTQQSTEFITSLRGVSSAQLDAFDKAKRAGDVYAGQRIMLQALNDTIQQSSGRLTEHSAAVSTSWKNFGQYINLIAAGLTVQQAEQVMLAGETEKWKQLQVAIQGATTALAAQQATPQQKLTQALLDSAAVDTTRTRLSELKAKVEEFKAALSNPLATDAMKEQFRSAIKAAQTEMESLNNKRNFTGSGFSNAGDKAIAEARASISQINADQTRGDSERRAAIQKTYDDLLTTAKLNAAQRLEVEKQRNDAITQANRQAATEKRQIDQSAMQADLRVAEIGFNTKRSQIEQEVAAGNITRQQGLQQLIGLTDEETDARLRAVQRAQQGYAQDTTFFQQKELEKTVITAEAEAQRAAIRRQIEQQSAQDRERTERQTLQEVMTAESAFNSALFSGRVGVLGALEAAGMQFVQAEIQQALRGATERMLLSKQVLANDQTLGQMGLLWNALFESQKTAATVEGEAARLGAKESAHAAGSAADVAMGSAQIMNDAFKAAAGAYSAVVGIPYVGPILAPIAAGTAFAAVAAFNTLTSLDTGTNYVPRDMPAQIHEGERVVPRADNAAMIAALNGGAANQGGGGGMTLNYHEAQGSTKRGRETAKDMVRQLAHARRIGSLKG